MHPYGLGDTAASGELEHLLGYRGFFEDVEHDNSAGVKPELSGMTIEAIWVKNETDGAVTPGQILYWDTGSTYGVGKAVKGEATNADADQAAAGVVDPYVTSVADNEHFWLIVKGPCDVQATATTTIAIGDALALGTAGRAIKIATVTTPTAKEAFHRLGTAMAAASTPSADDLYRAYVDIRP